MTRFEEELRARRVESYGLDVMAGTDVARRFCAALGLDLAQVTMYKVLPNAD